MRALGTLGLRVLLLSTVVVLLWPSFGVLCGGIDGSAFYLRCSLFGARRFLSGCLF